MQVWRLCGLKNIKCNYEDLLEHKLQPVSEFIGNHICKQNVIYTLKKSYICPEWSHRQGGCLACCDCKFESRWGCTDLYYARGAQGILPMKVEGTNSQLDSTVSDAIVRSWLWLTATRSSPLGFFSTLLQVVDNLPHILW